MSKGAKQGDKGFETPRPYRLSHQILCITGVNFQRRSLIGYVELHIIPLKPNLNRIKLNSKQCRIYRVCINDVWEASFLYNDPTLAICQSDAKQRNLNFFSSCHASAVSSVDADSGNGELTIRIPQEAMHIVQELKPLRVSIEYSLEKPQGGIQFVVPEIEGTMTEKSAHMFTYGYENSARLWFPCVDSYSEPCTWKLEFTVDATMTAVSSGDLIETVFTPDMRKKTYHYVLNVPTAAPNIALAVGPFEIYVDPYMNEVTHFCLPQLLPVLKHSTVFLHQAFEFFEEILGTRYPYTCYKQVFVDQAYREAASFTSMTIFSTNILHSSRIIDQTFKSRLLMAHAIAEQFFGSYISMQSWADAWLIKGIADYLSALYTKKTFGNNEYRDVISKILAKVCDYERECGGLVLYRNSNSHSSKSDTLSMSSSGSMHFPRKFPHTTSWKYAKMLRMKSHLVIRLIALRIGQHLLLQALNKLLSLASSAAQQKFQSNTWSNMLLSTNGFLKSVGTVSGKDLKTLMDQWVYQGGCVRFHGSFVFNRKRNIVEMELKQDLTSKGVMKYVGPLQVTIQELDGSFNHNVQIEENSTKHEMTCHSKSRRHKKKKIPLANGEEVDMDLSAMDADSPCLWIRIDPEMTTIRHVTFEQPDYQWQYQLRYERDVVAQSEAISALGLFPSTATRVALSDIIENEQCFYKVRMEATHCLAKVANEMTASWTGHTAMMSMFRKMFGSFSCPNIVRQNHFMNLQAYFIQKTVPVAMASIRNAVCVCPKEVVDFISDLIKYNDNRKNKFSDNYYRAALINALAQTITPSVSLVKTVENLSQETKLVVEEITRFLNLEKLLPCYRHVVTVSCLKAIRILQKNGWIPSDPGLFKSYAEYGHFVDIRVTALEALVDTVKVESNEEVFCWLLEVVEQDPLPYIRHTVLKMLTNNPPFTKKDSSPMSNETMVERIWSLMNSGLSHDARLRCDAVDLYNALWGRTRPSSLPIPELGMVLNLIEKKAVLNRYFVPEESSANEFQSQNSYSEVNESEIGREPSRDNKRKASSPLTSHDVQLESSSDPNISVHASEESQFKLKIMLGGKSIDEKTDNKKIDVDERKETEVAQGNTSSQKLEMDHRPIDSSFEDRPPTPGAMLPDTLGDSFKPATPKMEETLSSRSNTPSPILKNPTPLTGLTGGGNSTPLSSKMHSTIPPMHTHIKRERPLHGASGTDKLHKIKKKKKKNKHKHKHKHGKHDHHDKHKKHHGGSAGGSSSQFHKGSSSERK